jgi:ribosomal 50S subunit-recycling heat shock protein
LKNTNLKNGEKTMRLDKYLKVSRLIKRRTVANEACDGGRVSVNGKVVKASYDVKVGDEMEIRFGSRALKIKVTEVREQVGKSEAATLYEVLPEV